MMLKSLVKAFKRTSVVQLNGVKVIQLNFGSSATLKRKNLSYVHNNGKEPLQAITMGDLIDSTPDRYGDRIAIIDCSQNIQKTFAEYVEDINKLSLGLLSLNLKRGDRIGIWSPNRYEWTLAQFAAAKIGLFAVTLSPMYQAPELSYSMEKLGIRAIVAADTFKTQDYYKILCSFIPEIMDSKAGQIKCKKYPDFDTLIMMSENDAPPGAYKFQDILNAGGSHEKTLSEKLAKEINFDDAMNIQLTSGTTGRPKAVVLSHFGVINNAIEISRNIGFYREPHRICGQVPLFHCFGCVGVTVVGFCSGVGAVFPSFGFSAEHSLKAIETHKCTSIYGTPTMFVDILSHPDFDKTDFSSLKSGVISGAPCSPNLIQQIIEKMHCPEIISPYGATELSPVISSHENPCETKEKRMTTAGKVLGSTEVKVVDGNDKMVPFGEVGELCVRGYQVMKGYWNDEEQTMKSIKDGWYHTGDLGTLDENGYIRVTGRIKDMLIRGGENVYPREIEDLLTTHPKIHDANAFGVPDKRLGEEVCVWIKLKEAQTMTAQEVKDYCKQNLAYYKIPHYIRFVEDFPRTPTGKIQKTQMREEMEKIIGNS